MCVCVCVHAWVWSGVYIRWLIHTLPHTHTSTRTLTLQHIHSHAHSHAYTPTHIHTLWHSSGSTTGALYICVALGCTKQDLTRLHVFFIVPPPAFLLISLFMSLCSCLPPLSIFKNRKRCCSPYFSNTNSHPFCLFRLNLQLHWSKSARVPIHSHQTQKSEDEKRKEKKRKEKKRKEKKRKRKK